MDHHPNDRARLQFDRPTLGFSGYSGVGKTTLLAALIPRLRKAGLSIAVIKHAHHRFDIDHPGKDSFELRRAGAQQMLVASRQRWALIYEEATEQPEPLLGELYQHLDRRALDLVLVEGFKHESFSKIELHRPALGHSLLFPQQPEIIAVATDAPISYPTSLPQLDLNRPDEVLEFVLRWTAEWDHHASQ